MSFPTRSEYESLIYGLLDAHPEVTASTLRLYSTSSLTAIVEGELILRNSLTIRVLEVVDFKEGRIRNYSYAIYRQQEKLRWYDAQPHPENPTLAPTFPHHYHDPPDIKHNRLPAYGISFESPNLLRLIEDALSLGNG